MTHELKPCPFCGAHPELQQEGKFISFTVSRDWAMAAWNRRAAHSPDAGKMAAEPAADLVEKVKDTIFAHLDDEEHGQPIGCVSQACAFDIMALFAEREKSTVELIQRLREQIEVMGTAYQAVCGQLAERERAAELATMRAGVIQHAVAEYGLNHARETDEERRGRRNAVRGMMVRAGLYEGFTASIGDDAAAPQPPAQAKEGE